MMIDSAKFNVIPTPAQPTKIRLKLRASDWVGGGSWVAVPVRLILEDLQGCEHEQRDPVEIDDLF